MKVSDLFLSEFSIANFAILSIVVIIPFKISSALGTFCRQRCPLEIAFWKSFQDSHALICASSLISQRSKDGNNSPLWTSKPWFRKSICFLNKFVLQLQQHFWSVSEDLIIFMHQIHLFLRENLFQP